MAAKFEVYEDAKGEYCFKWMDNLGKLEAIIPAVRDLGRRHAGYGVPPASYDTVAAALLWTLGQGLGDAFTAAVEAAWTEAYTILATVMKEAAAA